ncbi:hypothetical protein KAZ93_04535 [Patescibacteria group bacterium]|nr:hypothetical protein [Patescibacteria group bacterium]
MDQEPIPTPNHPKFIIQNLLMDSLISLLTSLGLTPQQAQCFVVIYTYGPLPASTIASRLGIERTNCYKIIQ